MTDVKPLPWSLKGVSQTARDAARAAAAREGVPLGVWLGRTIREIARAEATQPVEAGPGTTGNSIERAMARLTPPPSDAGSG